MNTEQQLSLIRTIAKIGSGYLMAKGIGDSSMYEAVTAAVIAIASWWFSHQTHSTTDTSK